MSRKQITLLIKRSLIFSFALSLLFFLGGCSTYQSVTGYFNTYYNAKKIFDEAVRDLQGKTTRNVDSSYFVSYQPSAQVTAKFDKVIEKCSKIIQLYPQSNLVDDALLLIGKTYVYNDESELAVRKFEEFFEAFPTSDLRFEAKLWYAKAEYFLEEYQHSSELLRELIPEALQEGEDDIALEALMLDGQMKYENGDYLQASEAYSRAASGGGDGYLLALSQYYLGKCYEQLQRYEDAAVAYRNVLNFEPDRPLMFRATLNYGRMLTSAQQFEEALNTYDDLWDMATKPEEKAEIDLETATTYTTMGDTAKGFEIYRLMDTTYKKTDAVAKGYYRRAVLFENTHHDFRLAYRYYESAKNEFANSAIAPLAMKKSDHFARYFRCYENIARYDSLLKLALHPPVADSTSSAADSLQKSDSLGKMQPPLFLNKQDSLQLYTAESFIDSGKALTKLQEKEQGRNKEESVEQVLSREEDSIVEQDSLLAGEPDEEGMPRGRSRREEGGEVRSELQKDSVQVGTRATPPKQRQLSPDTLRYLINQERFELAGLMFLELNLLDSAQFWYETIYHDTTETPFKPRALYALAEVHRAKNDSVKVDSLYNELLLKYGETDFGKQIKKLLGMNAEPEEIDSGMSVYREAAQKLDDGNTQEALTMFKKIVDKYPTSSSIPKTLYAIGWIYETLLVNNDSAAVWYQSLLEHYPTTLYAQAAEPKVAVKNDTTSLSKYVKIKEIQLLSKQTAQRTQSTSSGARSRDEEGVQPTRGRGKGKNLDEEEEEEPEEIDIEEQDTRDVDDE